MHRRTIPGRTLFSASVLERKLAKILGYALLDVNKPVRELVLAERGSVAKVREGGAAYSGSQSAETKR